MQRVHSPANCSNHQARPCPLPLADNFNDANQQRLQGDFDYDGVVNALDFNMLAASFGQTLPGGGLAQLAAAPALGSLVPEPHNLCTLLASLALYRRRRR